MFCTKCGQQNIDDGRFCVACGASLIGMRPMPSQGVSNQQANTEAWSSQRSQQANEQRGCVGRALDDVKRFGGYGRLALLGLIGIVPILNFCSLGYSLSWAGNAASKGRKQMADSIVSGKNMALGFKGFVVNLVFMAAFAIVAAVLFMATSASNILTIIATIFVYVLLLATCLYVELGCVRMAATGSIGSAFSIGKVVKCFAKKPGSYLFIFFIPSLILAVPLYFIIELIMLLANASILSFMNIPAAFASFDFAAIMAIMLVSVLEYVLIAFFSNPFNAVIERAMGHFVALYAPEWAQGDCVSTASAPAASNNVNANPYQGACAPNAVYGNASNTAAQQQWYRPVPLSPEQTIPQHSVQTVPSSPLGRMPVSGTLYGTSAATPSSDLSPALYPSAAQTAVHPPVLSGQAIPSPSQTIPSNPVGQLPVSGTLYGTSAATPSSDLSPALYPSAAQTAVHPPVGSAPAVQAQAAQAPVLQNPIVQGSDKSTTMLEPAFSIAAHRVLLTDLRGMSFEAKTFPAIVGRGTAANCIISGDGSISRAHVCIHEYDRNGFVVEDLHSTNGTILNGNHMVPGELVILNDRDQLKMGDSVFKVRVE